MAVRVLVVEDDPRCRKGMCLLLEAFGYTCRSAADGIEALDVLDVWRPEAVIMDLSMPRLDGFEATRRIRSNPATRSIPILALTATSRREDASEADRAGVNAFLPKPANLSALLDQLSRLVPAAPTQEPDGV